MYIYHNCIVNFETFYVAREYMSTGNLYEYFMNLYSEFLLKYKIVITLLLTEKYRIPKYIFAPNG